MLKRNLKKILMFLSGISIIILLSWALENFKNNVVIICSIVFLLLFVLVSILKQNRVHNQKILSFLILIIFFAGYLTIRTSISIFRLPIMQEFSLNTQQFAQFSSFFSIGYGISQLLTGYCISRFGFYGIFSLAFGTGLTCFILSFIKGFKLLLISRFCLGMMCSGASCGLGYFINNFFPTVIFNVLYTVGQSTGIILANITNYTLNIMLHKETIHWRFVFKGLGIFCIVVSICFFISIIISNTQKKKLQTEDDIKNTNQFNKTNNINVVKNNDSQTEDISIITLIKGLVGDLRLILLCIYSATSTWLLFAFQDGYSSIIIKELFPKIFDFAGTEAINMGYGIGLLLCALCSAFIGLEISMLLCTSIQLVGIVTFFLYGAKSYSILIWSLRTFALCGASHLIAPLVIGKHYKGRKTAFYFGALNFSAMMIGASLSQFISGMIIHKSWLKHRTMLNDNFLYKYTDVFYMLKFFVIPAILCFICSIVLLIKYRKK